MCGLTFTEPCDDLKNGETGELLREMSVGFAEGGARKIPRNRT